MKTTDIIKTPILTEKSSPLFEQNRYTFLVDKRANKIQIKQAFETIFEVKVQKVNVLNLKRKSKRIGQYAGFTTSGKKAIIQLCDGYKLDLFADDGGVSKESMKEQKDGD